MLSDANARVGIVTATTAAAGSKIAGERWWGGTRCAEMTDDKAMQATASRRRPAADEIAMSGSYSPTPTLFFFVQSAVSRYCFYFPLGEKVVELALDGTAAPKKPSCWGAHRPCRKK